MYRTESKSREFEVQPPSWRLFSATTTEMEYPNDYINNIISEDNMKRSMDHLVDRIEKKEADVADIAALVAIYTAWMQKNCNYLLGKCKKDDEMIVKLERSVEHLKDLVRKHEKQLWNTSSDSAEDDMTWAMQLQEKNQRVDLLKSHLFKWMKLDETWKGSATVARIDDIVLKLYLESLIRRIVELEQEAAYLRYVESKDREGISETSRDKKDENEDEKLLNERREYLRSEANLRACIAVCYRPPVNYSHNLMRMQRRTISRLYEIEKTLVLMSKTNYEQDLLRSLWTLSLQTKNYVYALHLQVVNTSMLDCPKFITEVMTDVHKRLESFKQFLLEFCKRVPCADMSDKQKRRIAELEDQYAKLTKDGSATRFFSGNISRDEITVLTENSRKHETKIKAVNERLQKLWQKHDKEREILLLEDNANSIQEEEGQQSKTEAEKTSDKQETRDKDEHDIKEKLKGSRYNAKRKLKDIRQNIWRTKGVNCKLRDENQRLEMEVKMHKDMLNKLELFGDVDKVIAQQTDESEEITPEERDNLESNKNNFNRDKSLLYYSLETAYSMQTAIKHGSKYHDYLLKRYALAKDISQKDQEGRYCISCTYHRESLKNSMQAINIISHRMVQISAMFHMLPFKKFRETIFQYIITRGKVKSRRRKLRVERKKRGKQGERAKKMEQVKSTDTSETKQAEDQKPFDLLSDKYKDSLVASTNAFASTANKESRSSEKTIDITNDTEDKVSNEEDGLKRASEITEMTKSLAVPEREYI